MINQLILMRIQFISTDLESLIAVYAHDQLERAPSVVTIHKVDSRLTG